MRVFRARLQKIDQVKENLRLQFGSASYTTKTSFKRDEPKNTSFAVTSDSGSLLKTQCLLKDTEHKIWQYDAFTKMKVSERHEAVKERNLCFSCLGSGHRIGHGKANRTCGKDGCSQRRNGLFHCDDKRPEKQQNSSNDTNTEADTVLTANPCSGSLQIVPITLSIGATSIDTMEVCDTGLTFSFVDKDIKYQLDVQPGKWNYTKHCCDRWDKGNGQRKCEDQGQNSETHGVNDVSCSSFDLLREQVL